MASPPDDFQPPCRECGGSCCRYVAIEIDGPKTKQQIDHIRWYLLHENVGVFMENDRKWYVEFRARCRDQLSNGRCGRYADRPLICREYGNEEGACEYYASPHIHYFDAIEDFEKFLDKKGKDWRYKRLPP